MSSPDQKHNICKAFHVVRETHKEVQKLLAAIAKSNYEHGSKERAFINIVKGDFMRYNADKDYWGWMYSSFCNAYRKGGVDDLIYSIEINFDGDKPEIIMGKHRYKNNVSGWSFGVGDFWLFVDPRWREESFDFFNKDGALKSTPKTEETKTRYRELEVSEFVTVDLLDITAQNIQSRIFGQLDTL